MAGSFSNYLEGKLLDLVWGNTSYSIPATLYLALYTATPSDSGGGTEATGGSYARVAITNNTTNFPNASGGAKSNGTEITFPTATANWGTIVAWAMLDASSGGNFIIWGDVTPNKVINSGDTAKFSVGDLDWTLD